MADEVWQRIEETALEVMALATASGSPHTLTSRQMLRFLGELPF